VSDAHDTATTASAPRPPALPWARTPQLVLREFDAADRAAVVAMHSDPRLREHLVDDYPLHQDAVASLFLQRLGEHYRRHEGLGIWHATALQPQAQFAGWFSLMPLAGHPGEVEMGSRLLPAAWGRGLALAGCELLLDHAFDDLQLPRVWGICHPGNRSALAVLAARGFEPVGMMPYDGVPAQHLRVELNAWRALRNTPRGTRLRQALRSNASGRAMPATVCEGTCS
jgi:RimJ/RimL family protein N-acetyltransferase